MEWDFGSLGEMVRVIGIEECREEWGGVVGRVGES